MPGLALLLMGLQAHVPIKDVGGALQEGVDQVLVSTGYQLFDDLGLCLGQDAYGVCVPTEVATNHAPGTGVDTTTMPFPGCSRGRGGGGAVLTPLLRPPPPASGVSATESCCTVPFCHGECVQANEALVVLDSPYAPLRQQVSISWGPPCNDSPLLRPERRVHRRMPPEIPHRETGCCTSEISQVLTGWSQSPRSCGPWRTWRCGRRLSVGHYRPGILACPSGRPGTCCWGSWTGRCK